MQRVRYACVAEAVGGVQEYRCQPPTPPPISHVGVVLPARCSSARISVNCWRNRALPAPARSTRQKGMSSRQRNQDAAQQASQKAKGAEPGCLSADAHVDRRGGRQRRRVRHVVGYARKTDAARQRVFMSGARKRLRASRVDDARRVEIVAPRRLSAAQCARRRSAPDPEGRSHGLIQQWRRRQLVR